MISVPNDSSALSGLDPIAKRRRIAEGLWGLQLQSTSRVDQLRAYFEHFQDQAGQLNVSMDDVFTAAEILKESPDSTRQNLRNTIISALGHGRGIRNTTTSQIQRGNGASVPQDITTRDSEIEEIIVATLRVMLAVNINLDSRTVFLATPGLNWGESQSLTSFLKETFPKHAYDDEPHTPFMVSRLRARYLEDHADVQLEWTHHLPDHLMLNIGSQTKTLRVFDLVSLLEITYEVMKNEPWDTSVEDSLKRGCCTPAFLYETLQTIRLLFPPQDQQWLDRKIDFNSRWCRWRGNDVRLVDRRISAPLKCHHGETVYERPLTTRRELFERYPHWAVRLHSLYAESEDPAPVSRPGRWAQRKRSPRHTFWLTFIALVAAALFGIVATIIGAVQVWISWCQWKGQGSSIC
ncbi:uncharacterized protein FPRO_11192 [Fusarium proliferatum ET1]|uniref:Uncharacterized protein n=1 Tax=Fusarium proliferatum (strain ET1) TaxID=1227346 RepID=A0A1L7VM54_FUSPR|nr:uncharacterized protein FPRO_11192 [Fusarium proliferatum ET1]CZR41603.1 uncharacterized protein FPRO_11192 [Fusarium proliferatum ET1]